jgi:hypothetical protein
MNIEPYLISKQITVPKIQKLYMTEWYKNVSFFSSKDSPWLFRLGTVSVEIEAADFVRVVAAVVVVVAPPPSGDAPVIVTLKVRLVARLDGLYNI